MRIVVVAALVVACGSPQPKRRAPQSQPARWAPAYHVHDDGGMGSRVVYLEGKIAELERTIGALRSQVDVLASRVERPRSMPATPTSAPTTATPRTSSIDEVARWWCYETVGDKWGVCRETKADCERDRLDLLDTKSCERMRVFSAKECQEMAAERQSMTECRKQTHAACFGKKWILDGAVGYGCAPSIAGCKLRRATVQKVYADDIKVTSECKAVE